jgi:hypothetical protein
VLASMLYCPFDLLIKLYNHNYPLCQNLPNFLSLSSYKEKGFDFLHCTAGEVYFFILFYLFLIKKIKLKGEAQNSNSQMSIINIYQLIGEQSIEYEILQLITHLENVVVTNNDNSSLIQLINFALEEWKQANILCERCFNSQELTMLWKEIGLINQEDRSTKLFNDVFKFVNNYLIELEGNRSLEDKAENLIVNINRISHEESTILDKQKLTYRNNLLIESFNLFLYILFPEENIQEDINNFTSEKLINIIKRLHLVSRFPILPFFYLSILDDDKNPKEHLVFPCIKSYDPNTMTGRLENINSPLTCLLTVKKINYVETDYLLDLNTIFIYFREIADIISSLSYYGELVPVIQRKEYFSILNSLRNIWDKTSNWFMPIEPSLEQEFIVHSFPDIDDFREKYLKLFEDTFGFSIPVNPDINLYDIYPKIDKSLKHMCGAYYCGSSPSDEPKITPSYNLKLGSIFIIILLALKKGDSLNNSTQFSDLSSTQLNNWFNNLDLNSSFLPSPDSSLPPNPSIHRNTAHLIYEFFLDLLSYRTHYSITGVDKISFPQPCIIKIDLNWDSTEIFRNKGSIISLINSIKDNLTENIFNELFKFDKKIITITGKPEGID